MKNFFVACAVGLCFWPNTACNAAPEQGTPELAREFEHFATSSTVPVPWNRSALTNSEEQTLVDLRNKAFQVMLRDDYTAYMLALLDKWKGSDDRSRQELIRSVLNTRRSYTESDVPFLRSVFVAVGNFHYDDYPLQMSGWYNKENTRFHLSKRILGAVGISGQPSTADANLLFSNPMIWLDKFAPN